MRDAILQKAGFRTLRFWNSDIGTNLDGVVQTIQLALDIQPSPSWGGKTAKRLGGDVRSPNANLTIQHPSPDIPTRSALRSCPPHEGEGCGGGEQ
jgi:hypothetical protein